MTEERKCELTELAAATQDDTRSLALIECLREIDDVQANRDYYKRAFLQLSKTRKESDIRSAR